MLEKRNREVLCFIKGGAKIGMGHLQRTLAIAKTLKSTYGVDPFFLIVGDDALVEILKSEEIASEKFSEENLIEFSPKMVILDAKDDLSSLLEKFKQKGSQICLIDNMTPARLLADYVVYPFSHVEIDKLSWDGFKGEKIVGSQYFPLRDIFLKSARKKDEKKNRLNLLVTMGGADPHRLTIKIIGYLKELEQDFEAEVIIGPAFEFDVSAPDERFIIKKDNVDMAFMMEKADLAITAFGITLYELAFMGVPALIVNNYESDEKDVKAFISYKTALSLGFYKNLDYQSFKETILYLMSNRELRDKMALQGQTLVDGKGAPRIAKIIAREVLK